MSKLNNHDGLLTYNERGELRLMLFTSQSKSKSFISGNEKDSTTFVSTNIFCGNNQNEQFISKVSLDLQKDTCKLNASQKAEKFSLENADILTDHLNTYWGNNVIQVKNIKLNKND